MSSNAMADQSKVPADSNKEIPNGENVEKTIKQKSKKQEVAKSASTDILLKRPVLFQKILRGAVVARKTTGDDQGTPKRKIKLSQLQDIAFYGVPDSPKGLRSITWRVLLGLLPLSTSQWPDRLKSKRNLYKQFIADFITTEEEIMKNETEPTFEDNPLSTEPGSKWNTFFKDEELRETIAKDVHRTHPSYSFFTQGITYDVMKRMLFIFAKLKTQVCRTYKG